MTKPIVQKDTASLQDVVKEITITWHIEDIQSIRADLTDQQASDVLIHLKENHDATVGINWDTIETVADILFPSEESEIECEEDGI